MDFLDGLRRGIEKIGFTRKILGARLWLLRLTHNLINDFILPDHVQFFPRDFFYREGVCFQPVNLNFDLGVFFLQRFVALFERVQFLLKFAHCQKTVFIEHGGPYHRHKQREAHYQDALGATQIHGDANGLCAGNITGPGCKKHLFP